MIIAVYESKERGISYSVEKENGDYFIEAETLGGSRREKAFLGRCGENLAVKTAILFAERAVNPLHIEDIVSDMRF